MRRPSAFAPTLPWLALLGAVLCFFGANVGRTWDYTVDDAGISYSYARNLWNGDGLVLTPGAERVEAATNFLWILLLSPADGLGISHETLSKVLGLAFAGFALCAIAAFPAVAYQRRPRYFDLVAPLIAATFAHSALWTAAGLENGLFQFLAAATLTALAWEEHDAARFPWSAVTLGLLFATRPDGALYAVAVALARGCRIVMGKPRRQDLSWALTLGLMVGALELFRLAYFAWPFPNSFYTKKRTFDFGKDLTKFDSAGWVYLRAFVRTYDLTRALALVPALLLALRAPVARIALLLSIAAGLFFPVYSHGDWMEEWRFLTYVLPLLALGFAEAVRALARVLVVAAPRSLRAPVAIALTPFAAWMIVKETTHHYPARFANTRRHDTLEFSVVRGRARYYAAAARALDLRDASVLDPDVGGMSYDSGLEVVDLFGLGDVAIARTHPQDEPGMREAIFHERRPTFVHLHGAWYAAVSLERLEELDEAYLHLPGFIGAEHDDASNYVRRDALAAPWTEEAHTGPLFSSGPAGHIEGYTLSARGLEPGTTLRVELTFAHGEEATPGSIVAEPLQGGSRVSVPLHLLGDVVPVAGLLPGERPWTRARLVLPAGRYEIRWRNDQAEATLGTVTVARGEERRELDQIRQTMDDLLAHGRLHDARRLVLGLRLRSADDAGSDARALVYRYARALGERALTLSGQSQFGMARELAAQARLFGRHDPETTTLVQRTAERMAERSRAAERSRQIEESFTLARDAVLLDPRRSWMRRRAETLRAQRRHEYDGGREIAAYRNAAWALDHLGEGGDERKDFNDALVMLGSIGRAVDAAALVDRTGVEPRTPWARLVAARGYLSRGELDEARRLAATVPCRDAWDPSFAQAYAALAGRPYRAGDGDCGRVGALAAWERNAAPFDATEGSFEASRYTGWTATGTAFNLGPVHDLPAGQTFVNGWRGQRYATSFNRAGDAAVGTLRSREFTVSTDAISFLIGGGSNVEELGARLMVNGEAVRRTAGADNEGLHRAYWDVRQWRGQRATIEVYDTATGGWGHVMADDFLLEPVAPHR
ncbi:MAG: hypothetical protein JWM10_1712 [Myxococcaceae bacterium]|nr:hypothetical protein [Myxococcaceae bacterium]